VAKRKTGKINEWILVTVMLMMGVILLPMVVDQVANVDTASWNFTGYAAAKTMLGLLPFVFVVGIVICFIASILGKT